MKIFRIQETGRRKGKIKKGQIKRNNQCNETKEAKGGGKRIKQIRGRGIGGRLRGGGAKVEVCVVKAVRFAELEFLYV